MLVESDLATQAIGREVLKGREFCHRGEELAKRFPGYVTIEDRSMLDSDPPPQRPAGKRPGAK